MISLLLSPFSAAYRLMIFFWDIYWRNRNQISVPSKVISIGGLTAGGSGKTSLAGFIASKFMAGGRNVAVVARGYKRSKVSFDVINGSNESNWENIGDEPAELMKSIPGLAVYVNSDKTAAAIKAADDGRDPLIIDDGFQHRKLKRDIDIVCLDGENPFGGRMMLPAGRLREPISALKRADIMVIIDPRPDISDIQSKIPSGKPLFKAFKKVLAVRSLKGEVIQIGGTRCVAFCGIGNPQSFRNSLGQSGCDLLDFIRFGDHHRYSAADLKRIENRFKEKDGEFIVTTLKDAVRLEKIWNRDYPLYYLEIVLKLERENEFLSLISA